MIWAQKKARKMDEDNPFFLSFADALTCVLGSAIAMFLIFVTLAKVAPAEASAQQRGSADRLSAAVGEQQERGGQDIMLRIASEDCGAVESISVSGSSENWAIGRKGQPGADQKCHRLFRIDSTPSVSEVWVKLGEGKYINGPMSVYVVAGAEIWPDGEPYDLTFARGCSRTERIARVQFVRAPFVTGIGCVR